MKRKTRDNLVGFALFAFSGIAMVAMLSGAAYCDFDKAAIEGQCLQSIYNALTGRY